jgi:hypothetical protein
MRNCNRLRSFAVPIVEHPLNLFVGCVPAESNILIALGDSRFVPNVKMVDAAVLRFDLDDLLYDLRFSRLRQIGRALD